MPRQALFFFVCALALTASPPVGLAQQQDFGDVRMVTPAEGADFGPYVVRMVRAVNRKWQDGIPESARQGKLGEVLIRFRVLRDGAVESPAVVGSSGHLELDDAALSAISSASPLGPPPAGFDGPFVEFEFRFRYNPAPAKITNRKQNTPGPAAKKLMPKRVWTNDDLERPAPRTTERRPRQGDRQQESADQPDEPATPASGQKAKSSGVQPAPRQEEDPEYYRHRLTPLREELAEVESELRRLRSTPTDYRTGIQAERTASASTISNTVQNDIERLQRRKLDIEKRIAAIEAEAARNGVTLPY